MFVPVTFERQILEDQRWASDATGEVYTGLQLFEMMARQRPAPSASYVRAYFSCVRPGQSAEFWGDDSRRFNRVR